MLIFEHYDFLSVSRSVGLGRSRLSVFLSFCQSVVLLGVLSAGWSVSLSVCWLGGRSVCWLRLVLIFVLVLLGRAQFFCFFDDVFSLKAVLLYESPRRKPG